MAQDKVPKTLAKQLRTQRTAQELSLTEAARRAKLKPELAQKLETGAFKELEHDIYTLEALKRYARTLGLDPDELAQKYLKYRGELPDSRSYSHRTQLKRSFVTSRWAALLIIGFGVLAVLVYLFLQLRILAAPPRLEVIRPTDSEVVTHQTVQVQGVTDPGAEVFINNSPVVVGENGEFGRAVTLREGLNTISVEARSRTERSNRLTLDVIYSRAAETEVEPAEDD